MSLYDPTDPERKNGMLTQKQREFLLSDGSGYDRQTQNYHRGEIEERVRSSLADFALLFERWNDHDEGAMDEFVNDIFEHEGMKRGMDALIAMLYMANPYTPESGLQMLLLHGVTKAEHELSDTDMIFPKDVKVSVDPVEQVDYKNAIDKFRKTKLSDMTAGETKALVRLFDKSPTVNSEDLRELQKDLFEYYDEEFPDDWADSVEDRAENLRE